MYSGNCRRWKCNQLLAEQNGSADKPWAPLGKGMVGRVHLKTFL